MLLSCVHRAATGSSQAALLLGLAAFSSFACVWILCQRCTADYPAQSYWLLP